MTANRSLMRYICNDLFGDMTHGQKDNGRGNEEAGASWATSAKGQDTGAKTDAAGWLQATGRATTSLRGIKLHRHKRPHNRDVVQALPAQTIHRDGPHERRE